MRMLQRQKCPATHAKIIMEKIDSRGGRLELFKQLAGQSLKETLVAAKMEAFYDSWMVVVKYRNQFAHGTPEVPGDLSAAELQKLVEARLGLRTLGTWMSRHS